MTRWVRLARWLGHALALLLLLAAGVVAWDRWQLPPEPDRQAFIEQARQYHARIQRDEFGVPHISGPRDVDVAYGLAYAHAEDDFATIQDVVLATRGTLAAVKGQAAATTDYLVHLFGVWDAVNARYETDLPPEVRGVMQAYADGLNHYAALHPAVLARGLLPLTGKDIAAGFVFKSPFFFGMEDQLKRITAAPEPGRPKAPAGSNGIAVAPSRSADGATRLLVNSHQPYVGPVSWYEAVLESGEGWHVAGGFFPGSPFMLHGHNEHLGWAHTVNKPALITVYKLSLNPANENQYLLDGQWKDFETRDAALRVKLLGPLAWTFHRPVLHSVHGPVLKGAGGAYALRWAGMGEIDQPLQYFRENKARNLEEWQAAVRINAVPSLNYIYADEKGHIGFIYNGKYPDQPAGVDAAADLPGDRSALIWHGYLPASRVPQIWDPKSGFVFNSNNTPFDATGPGDQLRPEDFPASMGLETHLNNRALRVEETYGADTAITEEAFQRYKFDLRYSERSELAGLIRELLALDSQDPDIRAAQDLLGRWNRSADQGSREAALALLTAYKVLPYHGPRLMTPEAGLRQAIATLKAHFGRLDPTWGEVNRIHRGALDLGIDGARDTYRSVWGEPGTDGRLIANAGDTYIMFVQWDKNGRLSSRSIHQFGSATLDAGSAHYADQTPLFVAMQTKPVLFTQQQLAGHVREDYAPGQNRH
jgi:penicillin amidase/acyl-homoserine-lactone acylase